MITIVGGVVAAIIVAVVIPAMLNDGNSTDAPTEEVPTEASTDGDPAAEQPTDSTEPAPEAPAEGE